MKQKDIAVIILIVGISGLLSYFISTKLIGAGNRSMTAAVVEPIVSEFSQPDERYFNDDSVNPSRTIKIGESTNPEPFENEQ